MNPEEKNSNLTKEEERKPFKALRTYQGDIDEILSKGKASATTILVAEQKRREESPEKRGFQKDNRVRNRSFMFAGGLLFLIGVIVVPTVYFVRSNEKAVQVQQTKTLLGFSEEKNISISGLSKELFINKIISEKNSFKFHPNSILYINPVDESNNTEDLSNVIPLISGKIPGALSRSFENKYMIGIYSFDTNEPFIILTTNDYAESYAGMLKWEKAMPTDFENLFAIPQNISESGTFLDEEFHNKDLRILKDENNKTILVYSFIDRNTLVITTNENILSAIIGKYLINQQTK